MTPPSFSFFGSGGPRRRGRGTEGKKRKRKVKKRKLQKNQETNNKEGLGVEAVERPEQLPLDALVLEVLHDLFKEAGLPRVGRSYIRKGI